MSREFIINKLRQIAANNGTGIFNVEFVKRTTGEKRNMTASFNVKRGVNGVGLRFNPTARGLLPVHDMVLARAGNEPNKCKRFINLDTISRLKFEGTEYVVEDIDEVLD